MVVLERIACRQGRRDEGPNQELARELAAAADEEGIRELAEHLWDRDPAVRSDCLKVLYEVGYLKPELIAPYADDFLRLLGERQNRLVWGAMIALSTIAPIAADTLFPRADEIQAAVARGSVITVDNGIKTLALLAASAPERNAALFPFLLAHLERCRAKEVPQHAEHILVVVTSDNRDAFIAVLERRLPELTASQAARVRKVLRKIG